MGPFWGSVSTFSYPRIVPLKTENKPNKNKKQPTTHNKRTFCTKFKTNNTSFYSSGISIFLFRSFDFTSTMSIFHWKTFCWIFLLQTTFAPGRGRGFSNNNPSFPSSSSTLVSITIPTEEKVLENGRRRLSNLKAGGVWSYIFITSGNCDDVQGRESVDSRGKCLAYVESIHSKGDGTRDTMSNCIINNAGDCSGETYTREDYPVGCFHTAKNNKWLYNHGKKGGYGYGYCASSVSWSPEGKVFGCACRFQQAEKNVSPFEALDGVSGCETVRELTSGRCTNFLTAAECKALGDSSITSGSYDSEFTDETYPSGCYVQSNKYYYQQNLTNKCKHLLEVEDTTTQPYTCDFTKAQSYTIVTSGLSNARYNILTEEECETYVAIGGFFFDTIVIGISFVPGCREEISSGNIYYNSNLEKNFVVDYVANVFETVYMHCKLFLTHSYQNDLPSKVNYGHWIGNVNLELDRVGLLLALLFLFLGALCVFSWPSGRINNDAERFRRGTLFRWKMNRASMFSLVGFASVHSVGAFEVVEITANKCAASELLSEVECKAHASMSAGTWGEKLATETFPFGCYKGDNNLFFYNPKSNSISCSASNPCYCKQSADATCTCPNGTPTVAAGSGGTLCATNGDVDCSACDAGYTISDYVLAAVIDGTKKTWDHDNPIWTDDTVYDANGEKKTSAFNTLKSNAIRVSFEHGSCIEQFDYEHNLDMTLAEIFSSGEQIDKSPGRSDWIRLGCGEFAVQANW